MIVFQNTYNQPFFSFFYCQKCVSILQRHKCIIWTNSHAVDTCSHANIDHYLFHLLFQRHAVIRHTSIHYVCQPCLPLGHPAVVMLASIYHNSSLVWWLVAQQQKNIYTVWKIEHLCIRGAERSFICCTAIAFTFVFTDSWLSSPSEVDEILSVAPISSLSLCVMLYLKWWSS